MTLRKVHKDSDFTIMITITHGHFGADPHLDGGIVSTFVLWFAALAHFDRLSLTVLDVLVDAIVAELCMSIQVP